MSAVSMTSSVCLNDYSLSYPNSRDAVNSGYHLPWKSLQNNPPPIDDHLICYVAVFWPYTMLTFGPNTQFCPPIRKYLLTPYFWNIWLALVWAKVDCCCGQYISPLAINQLIFANLQNLPFWWNGFKSFQTPENDADFLAW